MTKREDFRKIMLYIIEGYGHTLTDTANHFGTTRQVIKNYVNRINDPNDEFYDEVLSEEVNEKLASALKNARAKAGSKSKKQTIISEDDALALRFKNIYAHIPLRELGKEKGCSFMTISNAINNLPIELKMAQDEMVNKMFRKSL